MNTLLIYFLFIPVLVLILLALNLLLATHNPDSEKVSGYESGFSPIWGQTRIPFNVQFYVIAILFLILDLEIFYLVPFTVSIYSVSHYGFSIFVIFFVILTIGFIYELANKVLNFSTREK